MNFNFKETYKSLSTAELLNIVKQTNDYQPEAVLVAIALLKERTITHDDHSEAERLMSGTKHNWIEEDKYLNTLSVKIENLVEPIVSPETEVNPQKWINILMFVLGIYAIRILTVLTMRWRRLFERDRFEYLYLFEIIEPLYLLITIFGLYKRKKWGWSLLMTYLVLRTISYAFGIFISIKYSFLRMHIAETVLWTLIYTGALYLLSRNHTRTYFSINDRLYRNTMFSAIIIYLLIQVFFKYF
jgi:hypothetical protein